MTVRWRASELRRRCWPVLCVIARCVAEGMTGLGMAYGAAPLAAFWARDKESGWSADPWLADGWHADCCREDAPAMPLSRRERRQWAKLSRQLQ
jgi:hypothetical protein